MCAKLLNHYASNAYYVASSVKSFLVNEVGWGLVETKDASATSKDYVLSSEYSQLTSSGTTVTGTFCIRLAGSGNYVSIYGYDNCFTTGTGVTYQEEIHDATYSRIKCPASEFQYWAIADSDCLKLVLGACDYSEYYHGYVGLIDSAYYGEFDEAPLLVFATSTETSSWGDGLSPVMTSESGGVHPYAVWSTYSEEYGVSARTSLCGGIRPILYLENPSNQQEVRGFPKGVYKIPVSCGGSGMQYPVSSGTYYAFSKIGTQSEGFMYGPVYL